MLPFVAWLLMPPLSIVGVFLDKHTFDLIGKSLDVNDICANLEDFLCGNHSTKSHVGITEHEGGDIKPPSSGLFFLVVNAVNAVRFFKV